MNYKTEYGTYEVQPVKTEYGNGNLAIELVDLGDNELFTVLTVNLNEVLLPNQAYVDINNNPEAEQFIVENGLGKATGKTSTSGFCTYPLYEFDVNKLNKAEEF